MINRAELTLEQRLVQSVQELQAEVKALKNRQLVGGDNLVVQGTNLASISDVFNSGRVEDYTVTFTPVSQILGQPQIAMSYYIDNPLDDNYLYPSGSALTPDQSALDIGWFLDWGRSIDSIGVRKWHIRIWNPSVSTFTVYAYFKIYSVKNPEA